MHRRDYKVIAIHFNATRHVVFRTAFIAGRDNDARKVGISARTKPTHTGADILRALDSRGKSCVHRGGRGEDRGGCFLHQWGRHCPAGTATSAMGTAADGTQRTEVARAGVVRGVVLQQGRVGRLLSK